MSIWDDITKGASDAASFAAKKTGEMTSLAKLKYKLHGEETKLTKCYEEIGRLYYSYQHDGKDTEAELAEKVSQIEQINQSINGIKAELCALRDEKICPACGEKIGKNDTFCPACGAKQEGETCRETEEETVSENSEEQK